VLAAAEQRATALNIGADRVLITSGHISEDEYARALAGWLQVPFERLDAARAACPLPDDRLLDAANAGLLPLRVANTFVYVVAPQSLGARHLVTGAHPLPKDRFRLTSPQRLPGILKDVPTWKEQGADAVVAQWRVLVGPKGMTPSQIAYWEGVIARWQGDSAKAQAAFNAARSEVEKIVEKQGRRSGRP
jgi:hypothetical protein